ncbi:serine hydrolase, partial [Streptomyces sp. NPDC023588]|uniref:serine hydrolase n=1 Tax=Streptomyces sp. NPDC023588 TaxID=3154907 RepID=UPI0033C4DBD4
MKAITVAGGSSDDPEVEGTALPAEGEADEAAEAAAKRPAEAPRTDPHPGPGTDTAAQTPAETPEAEAEAEAPDNTDAPVEPDRAEPQPPAEAPEDEADAQPEGDTADTAAQMPAEPAADGEADAKVGPDATAPTAPEAPATEPTPLVAPDVEAEAEVPDTHAAVEPDQAEPQADAATQVPAEAPEGQADAQPDGDTADTAAQTPAEAETAADTEVPDPDATVEPDQAEPQAEPQADAAAQASAEAPGDEADAEPDGDTADAAVQTPAAAAADDVEAPDADTPGKAIRAEPEAADTTAEAPVAEPADDAGDGPEHEPQAGPAQAKSARPAPSWARDGEDDAERTSRFVRLKGLDAAAPAAAPAQPDRPAAPLDLLASLTNSAAAPQSPRRAALRRVKVWTPVLLLLAGAYAGAQLLRPLPTPHIVAAETGRTGSVEGQFSIPWPAKGQGAVRISGSGTGDIGTFGEQKPVPTASVAKVMTAYVVLKGHPLRKGEPGPVITVDAKAVADGTAEHESRIVGLTTGTKFSQQDMLKMLMIPSGNNIARLLARWDTGTDNEAAFVAKMNAAARELGMKDTTYTDPSGLDAGTVSTAADQLKLAEAVMKDEAFRAIVALPNATIKGLPEPILNNNESLLTAQGLSIRGIKTGSSTPAGGTLMWAAYKSIGDETPLILGTLMDQRVDGPDPDAINSLALVKTNSKKIIEAVRTALASAPVVRKGQTVGYVDDGLGGRTPLVATKDLNVIGVPGQQVKLSLVAGASPLPHTAKAGSEVAVLTAGDGEGAESVPVAVRGALAEPSLGTRTAGRRGTSLCPPTSPTRRC